VGTASRWDRSGRRSQPRTTCPACRTEWWGDPTRAVGLTLVGVPRTRSDPASPGRRRFLLSRRSSRDRLSRVASVRLLHWRQRGAGQTARREATRRKSRNWRIGGLLDRAPRALPSCWREQLPPARSRGSLCPIAVLRGGAGDDETVTAYRAKRSSREAAPSVGFAYAPRPTCHAFAGGWISGKPGVSAAARGASPLRSRSEMGLRHVRDELSPRLGHATARPRGG